MSKRSLDVAQESTLLEIYGKIKEGTGIWCNPHYVDSNSLGNYINTGTLNTYTEQGAVVVNFRNSLYVIGDNSGNIVTPSGSRNQYWGHVTYLPNYVDVHNTCFIVFNDELHILGGSGNMLRAHFKWDGERWSVASELPYDFCNGRAVVYQNKLHILGGGTGSFNTSYTDGHVNYHYSWDGEKWEKASDLPYTVWGCTPFVCSSKLHLVGGGIINGTDYTKYHYVWDGISWSNGGTLSFPIFNGSAVKMSDTQVYVIGGMDKSDGSKQTTIKKYNGASWTNVTSLPTDAKNNTGFSATVDANRQVVIAGKRLFTLSSSGSYSAHMATPCTLDKGDAVLYRGEIHIFCQRNHYKWGADGWTNVSIIPYSFVGGSVVVYKDKIHLLGSSSSGVEDYHYTWCPEDSWKLKPNLPEKFSNGSAVVFNDEIHIIGGTVMNDKACNHYRLINDRWEMVGHSVKGVIGPKCAVSHNGFIYAATQDADGTTCEIRAFNGYYWRKLGYVTTHVSGTNYRYLTVFQNRIHLLVFNSNELLHYVFTGLETTIGHAITYATFSPVSSIPCVVSCEDGIFVLSSPKADMDSILQVKYAVQNAPTVSIYIPEGHQIICNKNEMMPLIGEMEETDTGYKALTTGLHTLVNYADSYTIT